MQDQNYGGTPLAMLAAQCSRISNKSPPPLADAAVGKGFHPWKKATPPSSLLTTSPTQHPASSSPRGASTNSQNLYAKASSVTSAVTSSVTGSYNAAASDLLSTTNTCSQQDSINMSKLPHHQTDSGSLTSIPNMYSRVPAAHPYESAAAWPYNVAAASAQQAAAIKGSTTAADLNNSAWWDLQSQALGSSAWLSADIPPSAATSNSLHHSPLATAGNSPYSCSVGDYAFGSFASNPSPFLAATTGQHPLQDSYKMYGASPGADLSSTMSSALLTRPTSLSSVAG